ncbi:hypothetical protein PUN28_009511 [Cardiocondyla obscurior]|uniref:Uncharacterized protein n=1 Tax=Cardiocondyla obscurior TaxID=286306 RepID=A0AAW2FSH9_9HYME
MWHPTVAKNRNSFALDNRRAEANGTYKQTKLINYYNSLLENKSYSSEPFDVYRLSRLSRVGFGNKYDVEYAARQGRVSPQCPPFADVINLRCRKTFARPLRDLDRWRDSEIVKSARSNRSTTLLSYKDDNLRPHISTSLKKGQLVSNKKKNKKKATLNLNRKRRMPQIPNSYASAKVLSMISIKISITLLRKFLYSLPCKEIYNEPA